MNAAPDSLLVDTSVIITALKDKDSFLLLTRHKCFINPVVLGELVFGAKNSGNATQKIAILEKVLSRFYTINITASTASHYADIRARLKKAGKPIPSNDMWIAASALENQLPLLTSDKHFESVAGLNTRYFQQPA